MNDSPTDSAYRLVTAGPRAEYVGIAGMPDAAGRGGGGGGGGGGAATSVCGGGACCSTTSLPSLSTKM